MVASSEKGLYENEMLENKELDKPKFLYHSSSNSEITEFEPRAESIRDPEEGPVVFATPDKTYASMFIVPSNDKWTSKGRWDSETWTHVIGDIERYKKLDKGGTIYKLDSETFESDENRNMHTIEWTSKDSVTPVGKETFPSGLKAMIELGVEVYAMPPKQFEQFRQLNKESRHEEAREMLQNLESLSG